jgi:hypothetical protein
MPVNPAQKCAALSMCAMAALFVFSCDRKEGTPAASSSPAKEEAAPAAKKTLSQQIDDLGATQEAVAKDLAAATDAKSLAATMDRLAGSMEQWLKLVPAMESAEDPDGTLVAATGKVGKAMGGNYTAALKASEPFKEAPEISARLGKLQSLREELMK